MTTARAGSPPRASGHHEHDDANHTYNPERKPAFFDTHDYLTITRLADLIIPRTDTPGAAEAGVPWRIDQALGRRKELQSLYRDGLASLNSAAREQGQPDFLHLAEPSQVALLQRLCDTPDTPGGQFFQSVKALTIEWYYNSREGLVDELGFKGNTYRTEFTGCTHPEHWPSVAQAVGAVVRSPE